VRHHSTLVLNIRQGSIDFIENYNETDATKHYGNCLSAARAIQDSRGRAGLRTA
jgi:hypothetical protein